MAGASLGGAAKVRALIKKYQREVPDEVGRALRQETEIDVTVVKRRTPVRHGTLRASVHGMGPFRQGKVIYCFIAAGGPSAPYAIYVHENLKAYHKVGQAKFIESVIMESRATMLARVAKRVQLARLNR